MTGETDNLVLEHLRAIPGDMAKMANRMDKMAAEMTAIRQHLAGVITLQEHDHIDMASIKLRLDRIEKRLDIVE